MTSTRKWTDLLKQQYALVADSKGGLGLLLAMRKFVNFLNTDPQARRYVKQMECEWKANHKKWLDSCSVVRAELSELEERIRAVGARLDAVIESPAEIADADAFDRSKHILDKIKEIDWYQSWNTMTDALHLEALHIERPRQTQTGHMISHVWSMTNVLATRLAGAVAAEEETTKELQTQAEDLWRRYGSAQWKVKNDWMSSGIHALKQLRIAVGIMDGDIFVDPTNYELPRVKSLMPWMVLMIMYAPSADLKDKFKWWLRQPDAANKDFEEDLEPLIRSHSRQVFAELLFLANSRLAHQVLIERYKMRCENYDWKRIAQMIQGHAEQVSGAEREGKKNRYHFENLLTLHLARYLHDNGYAVHYTPRHGVHEPDLLGRLSNDLEPIVVEAKVVGQPYGTEQGLPWIEEGLRALLAYLQKYHSDYGVTDGYLIVFRMGDEKSAMYTFDPPEWIVSGFTIVPKVINVGRINKKAPPVIVRQDDFLQKLGDGVS